jgi:hypothetical protein
LPPANARSADLNQDPDRAERDRQDAVATKFASVLARLRSPYPGERDAALAAATRMFASHGEDIAAALRRAKERDEAVKRAEIADAAARDLIDALTASEARVAELEAALARGGGGAVWNDVSTAKLELNPQAAAAWMLNEHAAKRLYLNKFELEFLPHIAAWVGPPSARQQPVFDRIVASVARRPGGRRPGSR